MLFQILISDNAVVCDEKDIGETTKNLSDVMLSAFDDVDNDCAQSVEKVDTSEAVEMQN